MGIDPEDFGAYTTPATVTVQGTVPGVPVSLTLTGGAEEFTASWYAPDDGGSAITGYYVEYRPGTSGSFVNITVVGTTTTVGGLSGGDYQVKVAAISSIGTGLSTALVSVTAKGPALVPGVPSGLTLTGGEQKFHGAFVDGTSG